MECVKDCWKCKLEGCPITLVESSVLDREVEKDKRIYSEQYMRVKDWRMRNKDKVKEYADKWNNSESHKKSLVKHRQTEKYDETTMIYRQTEGYKNSIDKYNKSEKRKETARRYRENHREELRERDRQRKLRLKNA